MQETMNHVSATLTSLKTTLVEFGVRYGFQILGASLIVLVGLKAAGYLTRMLDTWLEKKTTIDVALRSLIVRLLRFVVVGATIVIAAEKIGVPVASLIAGLGVAGVGIGLAMQGVLSNLIAGMTIFFLKPFRVGEYIDVLKEHGEVVDITLFSTTLRHTDQSLIVIPNRQIAGEILHNYGMKRQLDIEIGIAYASDIGKAIDVATETVLADPRVLKEPAPLVGIRKVGDSALTVSVRPWVPVPEYEQTLLGLYRAIFEAYRERGIDVPHPQREIRVVHAETGTTRAALGAPVVKVN
ncbi:mechanosensitive ion channel family protein [Polyangium mundeleinium]|uniref:Mechanosensitive ion channel family protein n=1 Tax=Polyangium mundeleinium TaxID=2995306 RepID=A0ABT5F366_9BACT|nr:mechanosensitive ion channel family protein [Polyangium mundeleinium]MDC0748049.1 mechanosensitive ion channel family protein [Polyangium mundeleinium]